MLSVSQATRRQMMGRLVSEMKMIWKKSGYDLINILSHNFLEGLIKPLNAFSRTAGISAGI
jgi:hypothetical protein